MLHTILLVVVLLVMVVLVAAASRPSTFRVSRTARMRAPADAIFAHLNDFHQWAAWSPWEKLDPAMQKTFIGPASGLGAGYAWSGNSKAGQGRMTITESIPSSRLILDLQFEKPYRAKNVTTFTLAPADGGTSVNWAMEGASPFMFRLMGLFMNMDRMIGKDFEAGLANLATIVER